jgi:protein phosphatase-4 regulatory subunit 3
MGPELPAPDAPDAAHAPAGAASVLAAATVDADVDGQAGALDGAEKAEDAPHAPDGGDAPAGAELADDQIDFLAAELTDADGGGPGEMDMDMDGPPAGGDDGWPEGGQHELKRVKVRAARSRTYAHAGGGPLTHAQVYELIGQRWVDQGTAFCTGGYDSALGAASLVARAETDYTHIILQTRIRGTDTYQRQQDTLIVWTEPSGVDYALSFQDPDGCAAVWQFIEDVQQHIHNDGT